MLSDHTCTPAEAMRFFKSDRLFALFDVREQAEFLRGHILLASCAPLSRLEFVAPLLTPCTDIPVILVDSGDKDDSRAVKASELLVKMGYTHLMVLTGGLAGWRKAGYIVMDNASGLARGYAEYLEQAKKTPGLTPAEAQERLKQGEKIAFIDIRVPSEHASVAIPGSLNAPGCESAYRFLDLVPMPDTLVLVNCSARTRGILCAQMLIDLGVPNPVASLKGGTMNWRFSGYNLEYGNSGITAPPSAKALAFARDRANALAREHNIQFVDAATLRRWRAKADKNPLYIFDIRQPEEYEAGHLPGSRSAQGGQLVQRSDEYAAVRGARFVLVDDTEARAIITAYWLKQIAIPNVYVLKGGLGGSGFGNEGLERGPEPLPVVECSFEKSLSPEELSNRLFSSTPPLLINVGYSDKHRTGHVPGAAWVPRGCLEQAHRARPDAACIVLTADCEMHARLSAEDAATLWPDAEVLFLQGGTPEWIKARLPLEVGMPRAFSAEDDVGYLMYMDPNATLAAMENFFDWKHEVAKK